MFLGLLFAISACLIWGLVFVIPIYLPDFSAIEVVLGRYFVYGIFSLVLASRITRLRKYTGRTWMVAFLFALVSNLVYYLGLVAGLRFATPTLTVLIVGMAPIVIAFYGNWKEREIAFRSLVLPCLLIGVGLVLINVIGIDWSFQESSFGKYLLGMLGVGVALLSWSWYAVHNARFLKRHPHIPANEWSTILGVATLVWTLLFALIFCTTSSRFYEIDLAKLFTLSSASLRYWGGVGILGALCSWVGCFLWSRASLYLPVSLMGPLLMFETLFGLLFVFLCERNTLSLLENSGIVAIVAGVLMSVLAFRRQRLQT